MFLSHLLGKFTAYYKTIAEYITDRFAVPSTEIPKQVKPEVSKPNTPDWDYDFFRKRKEIYERVEKIKVGLANGVELSDEDAKFLNNAFKTLPETDKTILLEHMEYKKGWLDHVKDHPYILITVISAVVFGYGWYATGCTFEGFRDSLVGGFTLITGYITGHSTHDNQNTSDLSPDKNGELKYSELPLEGKKAFLNKELTGLQLEKTGLELQEIELVREKMQLEKENRFPERVEEIKSRIFSIRACLTDHDDLVQTTQNELHYLDNPNDRPSPKSPVNLPADPAAQGLWNISRTSSSETVTLTSAPQKPRGLVIEIPENYNPLTPSPEIDSITIRDERSSITPTPAPQLSPISFSLPTDAAAIQTQVSPASSASIDSPTSPASTVSPTTPKLATGESTPTSSNVRDVDDATTTNPLPEDPQDLKTLYKNASNTFDETQTLLNNHQVERETSDLAIENKKAKVLMNRIEDHLKDKGYNITYIKSDNFVDVRRMNPNPSDTGCIVNEGIFAFLLSYFRKTENTTKYMIVNVPARTTVITIDDVSDRDWEDMELLRVMDKHEILEKVPYQELLYFEQLFELFELLK